MTYVVVESCIKCKYMDCVEVCPVDCFYEGENMLVIHPDECIDCGVCVPECPVDAIKPDTDPGLEEWLSLNTRKFGQTSRSKKAPRPTLRSGRGSQINCNTSHQIPVWVIEAVNARAASVPAPARFSNLQCPLFARMRTSDPDAKISTSLVRFLLAFPEPKQPGRHEVVSRNFPSWPILFSSVAGW